MNMMLGLLGGAARLFHRDRLGAKPIAQWPNGGVPNRHRGGNNDSILGMVFKCDPLAKPSRVLILGIKCFELDRLAGEGRPGCVGRKRGPLDDMPGSHLGPVPGTRERDIHGLADFAHAVVGQPIFLAQLGQRRGPDFFIKLLAFELGLEYYFWLID